MDFSKIRREIKLEANLILPKEDFSLQELWFRENDQSFTAFSKGLENIVMKGTYVVDRLVYQTEKITEQELENLIENLILLNFNCFSIRTG